jgi:hypothetical protein
VNSAIISDCKTYRYTLSRSPRRPKPEYGPVLWCLLNPSKANSELDDPTSRRVMGFSDLWRCDGSTIVNTYALRATDPKKLWEHEDPVGPENDFYLDKLARECRVVVCAWGVNAKPDRVKKVVAIFKKAGANMFCLGVTHHGHPRHPLYVRADQPLVPWEMP